jgi:signal transduction histidine kinase
MSWRRRLIPHRADVLLAAGLVVLSQVEVWWYGAAGGSLAASLTLGLAAASMLLRGRQPVLTSVLVSVWLALCAQFAGEPFSATSVLTFTIALFSVGAMPQRRTAVVILGVFLALALFAVDPLTVNNYLAIALASLAVPWLLGRLWLHRRDRRHEQLSRQRAAQEAVAAERLRLARELHDVVSHNVGMIAVQAGAADVLFDKDPSASRESLHAIEGGARATLLELRRLLGLLREDDPDPLNQPTRLADLPMLVEPVGRAGVEVQLVAQGEPVPLIREVEATAFRVIQEALTNVVAHAGQ